MAANYMTIPWTVTPSTWTMPLSITASNTIATTVSNWYPATATSLWYPWLTCGTCASTTSTTCYEWLTPKPQSIGDRLKEVIRARQAPLYLPSHRKLLLPTTDERELRARQTFRRIVGEHNWRTYCGKGHVSVRAKSGRVYQMFAGHDVTRVYENGRMTERLCVVLNGDYPPTDAILMRYVLILSDEATFRRVAVRTAVSGNQRDVARQDQSAGTLLEAFKKLKASVTPMRLAA